MIDQRVIVLFESRNNAFLPIVNVLLSIPAAGELRRRYLN